MSSIDPKLIESASLTAIGRVRSSNQDYYDEFHSPTGSRLLVVADGMGGHRGGATASRVATEAIGEVFKASTAEPPDTLSDALTAANQRVHRQSIDDPELSGMGTTVVALLFDIEGRVWVAHVGDSRAYRLHATGMEQITQDHSVVGEMVRRGLISPEEAETHPRRNEILRSVGVEAEVEIDVAQVVSAAPGDRFVLCSDGLTGLVSDLEIAEVVQSDSPEDAARRLVDMANDRGGHDNITVQIALLPSAEAQSLDSHPANSSEQPQAACFNGIAGKWIAGLSAAVIVVIVAYLAVSGVNSEPEPTTSGSAIESRDSEQNLP